MTGAAVAVCVPTFRRPKGLERCLRSLDSLTFEAPVRIIVADNDAVGREGAALCERLKAEPSFGLDITILCVSQRGIAPTRNALVAEALEDPDLCLIAMIDDDEWAAPHWLSDLVRVQARYAADIVGGPVLRRFAAPVPDYVARANQPDYAAIPTGSVGFVDATSNILFAAALFRERPGPWFDVQYALMGCEDMDLLLGFKLAGKRFAWAGDASVTEDMPASRSSARWMIQRAFRTGNTDTLVKLKHRPPGFTLASEGAKIAAASLLAAVNVALFAWHPARRFEGLRLGARVLGKLLAVLGRRYAEYEATTHGC